MHLSLFPAAPVVAQSHQWLLRLALWLTALQGRKSPPDFKRICSSLASPSHFLCTLHSHVAYIYNGHSAKIQCFQSFQGYIHLCLSPWPCAPSKRTQLSPTRFIFTFCELLRPISHSFISHLLHSALHLSYSRSHIYPINRSLKTRTQVHSLHPQTHTRPSIIQISVLMPCTQSVLTSVHFNDESGVSIFPSRIMLPTSPLRGFSLSCFSTNLLQPSYSSSAKMGFRVISKSSWGGGWVEVE